MEETEQGKPIATHLPFGFNKKGDDYYITGHMAYGNPQRIGNDIVIKNLSHLANKPFQNKMFSSCILYMPFYKLTEKGW